MKKQYPRLHKIILFSLLFIACKSREPAVLDTASAEAQGTVRYRTISDTRSIVLYPELNEASPKMHFEAVILDIDGPEPLRKLFLDALYQGMDPGEYLNSLAALFDGQYKAERQPEMPDPGELSAGLNWEYAETFEVLAQTAHTAVICQSRESYFGGAHGMSEKIYFVFALDELRRLRLGDLIKKEAEPALQDHITEALRVREGLAPGAPLRDGWFFVDEAAPSEDFFLSREGLGFQWDVYEIASFAMGPIEVIIPYEKIIPLCTPRGLSLIQEF
jgi:hypothetical protein